VLAQRRDLDRRYIQQMVEILAETSGMHLLLQAVTGAGDDAYIEVLYFAAVDAYPLAGGQYRAEVFLQIGIQLGDIIEKQGAATALFQQARGDAVGILAAQQQGGAITITEAAAVNIHEGTVAALATAVQILGAKGLATAGFTDQQYRGIEGGGVLEAFAQMLHPWPRRRFPRCRGRTSSPPGFASPCRQRIPSAG